MHLGLILAREVARGRVDGDAHVVHVGDDLVPAGRELREEVAVRVEAPALRPSLRVRLAVQAEGRLAAERVVGVAERLAVTEADERVEDAAQRLLGAQVVDARHQVAVGDQPAPQTVVVRADVTHQPAEQRVDDVRVELRTVDVLDVVMALILK